jgi:simple sugar transport system permease protein
VNHFLDAFNSDLAAATVRISIPVLLAALGGLMVLRAGLYNIALEGQMLAGSFAAVAVASATGSSWLGVLAGVGAGTVTSLVHSVAVLHYRANDIVASIAVNLLALGLTGYLVRAIYGSATLQPIGLAQLPAVNIPGLRGVPVLGPALSGQSVTVYIAFGLVIVTYFLLYRTNFGIAVRLVGENPEAAETVGVSPLRVRLWANTYCGMLCGLAGAHLALGYASQFTDGMTQGRGYTAFSAAVFGQLSPLPTFVAALFFGFAEALGNALQVSGVGINPNLLQLVPYVLAVVALSASTLTVARRRGKARQREVNQR